MSLLEIRDLYVTYGTGAAAVRGVDLTIAPGQKLGIAGESGCGKSTLAMAILRLLPSSARLTGSVLLDGEDVLTMKWGRLRAVRWAGASIVFQGAMHSLNAVHRIGDQIAEPILLHGLATPAGARTRVGELLEQVGLPASRADAHPHELSGGGGPPAVFSLWGAGAPPADVGGAAAPPPPPLPPSPPPRRGNPGGGAPRPPRGPARAPAGARG
ncbi:ATP-binding cassette domain-containing protein, partial [Streptomyces violascens]|uniref:ATP-binding cassette domain-containing protein n=1 Tax=Streptomyces violascens TaxID=67381 RepID=UPI0036B43C4A